MKRAIVIAAVLVLALAALPALAAESWTGWITDTHCGEKGANAKHTKECVMKCAKDGKIVFFNSADKKLYDLDKTEAALEHVGHEVKVTGTLDGSTIKVESIEMVASE
jgi:hypothetical protein